MFYLMIKLKIEINYLIRKVHAYYTVLSVVLKYILNCLCTILISLVKCHHSNCCISPLPFVAKPSQVHLCQPLEIY